MLEDGWPLQESWQVNPLCLSTLLREEHMDMVILDVGGDRSHLLHSSSFSQVHCNERMPAHWACFSAWQADEG